MNRPEQAFHQQVAQFLNVALGGVAWWTTIGHGRPGRLQSAIQKGMGVKPGVPDIMVIDGGRAIFIELKAPRGQVSEAQRECHRSIRRAGSGVRVCKTLDEVISALEEWGVPLRYRIG